MTIHTVKLPDVGEGIAEAELIEWRVAVGDEVKVDDPLADVMTDKVTAEVCAPVSGIISFLSGEPGDMLAVGSDFVGIEVGEVESGSVAIAGATHESSSPDVQMKSPALASRSVAAPAVRQQAKDLGIDLAEVVGTGPDGRVTHADLEQYHQGSDEATERIRFIGLRKRIAEKMTISASRIPHFAYVDEVDVTAVEDLRATLNTESAGQRPKLTLLPFLMRAMLVAVQDHPHLNATFDDEAGILTTYTALHIGVATQTPNGLMVPVVHDVATLDLWQIATEIARVAEAARTGSATRHELSGSTITVTSLGALSGLVTTPIINHPEVAIVGVNKMQIRPVWNGQTFVPRTMMNLSSSFDHRVVDGWVAAKFIQRIKVLLEQPESLLIDRSPS